MMMRPVHVRMARAALGWTLKELAERSRVNMNTISRYEAGKEVLSGTIENIERVFTSQGITFVDQDDDYGPGIRLAREAALESSISSHRAKAQQMLKPKRK